MKETIFGGCHCGAVRFSCALDLAAPTMRCNCSICSKARYWFAPVPAVDFTLLAGESELADYRFGSHSVHHRFCRKCGIKTFGEASLPAFGGPFFAVSVPCLELAAEVLAQLPVEYNDGASGSGKPPAITRHL
jgi:hypothetical protein